MRAEEGAGRGRGSVRNEGKGTGIDEVERVRKDGRGVDKDEDDGRCMPGTGTGCSMIVGKKKIKKYKTSELLGHQPKQNLHLIISRRL